jgi:hypothetical protein
MGKGPSATEKARYKPPVVSPYVTWMGNIRDICNEREQRTALNLAANASSSDGALTVVEGLRVHHVTTPGANFSIWFIRNVSGINISVYGRGRHVGQTNKKYDVDWYDGKSVTVHL